MTTERELLTNEEYEDLIKIIAELRRFCHHPDCQDSIDGCPAWHTSFEANCKERLDIHTAVCWELAMKISKFLNHNYIANDNKAGEDFPNGISPQAIHQITSFSFQVFNHHATKHRRAYSAICDLLTIFEIILQRQEENPV